MIAKNTVTPMDIKVALFLMAVVTTSYLAGYYVCKHRLDRQCINIVYIYTTLYLGKHIY